MKKKLPRQTMGKCERCGYLSSQAVCKACMLLEGLNKNRPKMEIQVSVEEEESGPTLTRRMEGLKSMSVPDHKISQTLRGEKLEESYAEGSLRSRI